MIFTFPIFVPAEVVVGYGTHEVFGRGVYGRNRGENFGALSDSCGLGGRGGKGAESIMIHGGFLSFVFWFLFFNSFFSTRFWRLCFPLPFPLLPSPPTPVPFISNTHSLDGETPSSAWIILDTLDIWMFGYLGLFFGYYLEYYSLIVAYLPTLPGWLAWSYGTSAYFIVFFRRERKKQNRNRKKENFLNSD